MANAKKSKSTLDARRDTLLTLATKTAKSDLGDGATNKSVEAQAVLATTVTENGQSAKARVNAGVTLGITTSTEAAAPACCACSGSGCSCGC